ncbi:hypothetical protein STRDD10_01111 [Streptococcus sp. DD10]|uniref:serine hydrolase n=1 Tax=Streptococcus sp. DD10 TaxID=1777878 RepID=UPI000792EA44|nr:serine hydrolase [Streptococcus sp. DD10]KXT74240.1 hypothetical protein STRDD10_01111 [Streptococcus sp. DD10]
MRKYFFLLLSLSGLLTTQTVISTEQGLTKEQEHVLTTSNQDLFYNHVLKNPNVYQELVTYKNADLTLPSGKLLPNTSFEITELRVNQQGIPIFKLKDNNFIVADKRFVFDDVVLSNEVVNKTVWIKKGFKLYEKPLVNNVKEVSSKLTSYSKVTISQVSKTNQGDFAYIDGIGWISTEFISDTDNRIDKVQELLTSKYQRENLSIFVKQIDNDLTAGVNEDKEMYSASITKLLYLYYSQKMINEGNYSLRSPLRYKEEVNDFSGAYETAGTGSLPKDADNKDYSVEDVISRTAKESDNVGSNLLGYYLANQSDERFHRTIDQLAGRHWDVEERDASTRMASYVMEALYHQGGFVLDSMLETQFDNQRISKDIDVKVAHKIGDAYDFKHDVAVVYTDTPFILSIFTEHSDYDTISQIAKDIYEVLK